MLLNCGVGEDNTLIESPLDSKEIQPVHSKGNQSWIFIGRTDVEAETPIFGHLMWRTNSLEKTLMLGKMKAEEGDDRGWDGWMVSPTQWTWVWVSSRSWWWTGRPGVLQSMRSQTVWHDWATELIFAYVESLLAILECLKPCTCFNWIFNFFKCFYLFTLLGQVLVSAPRIVNLRVSMPTIC